MTDEAFMRIIKIGDEVMYAPFLGGTRVVTVSTVEADVKNGRAGFTGIDQADGFEVWGYAHQIVG